MVEIGRRGGGDPQSCGVIDAAFGAENLDAVRELVSNVAAHLVEKQDAAALPN